MSEIIGYALAVIGILLMTALAIELFFICVLIIYATIAGLITRSIHHDNDESTDKSVKHRRRKRFHLYFDSLWLTGHYSPIYINISPLSRVFHNR